MPKLPRPKARIRALISDVDGVWTDSGMYFDADGQAMKRFDVKDGYIVHVMQEAGVSILWVTGDDSEITRARAERLGIDEVCGGVEDKGECVRRLLESHSLRPDEVVYIGDDLSDLPGMAQVGIAACPADAVAEVIASADLVTTNLGGKGAVREVCDLILTWNAELQRGSEQ